MMWEKLVEDVNNLGETAFNTALCASLLFFIITAAFGWIGLCLAAMFMGMLIGKMSTRTLAWKWKLSGGIAIVIGGMGLCAGAIALTILRVLAWIGIALFLYIGAIIFASRRP